LRYIEKRIWGAGASMRVISGSAKGHRLRSVPGERTRPVTDRAKSALFDILGGDVRHCRFLDLFAGTGQVGIEALSRGADEAVFVEKAAAALRTIHHNLAHTRLESRARVIRGDVFAFLEGDAQPFDYVYVAPPQYRGMWIRTLEAIDRQPTWLAPEGQAVAQIHPKEYGELATQHLQLVDRRRYGTVMLCFYSLRAGSKDAEPLRDS
jgi:16S rRNA (guanine966-N2)-methyltransferase